MVIHLNLMEDNRKEIEMTVENLANLMMGELGWINFQLMIVVLITVICIAFLSWKIKKQNDTIEDLLDVVDYLDKTKVSR